MVNHPGFTNEYRKGCVFTVVRVYQDNVYPSALCWFYPHQVELVKRVTPTFTEVGRLIKAERKRQDTKFGPKGNLGNLSREERLAVLTEEVGELAMAINNVRESDVGYANMHDELVQVAAVAVAWLEVLKESGVEG